MSRGLWAAACLLASTAAFGHISAISATHRVSAMNAAKRADCKVAVSPRLAMAPLNTIRVTTTIEPLEVLVGGQSRRQWREAKVWLLDEMGELTSTTLFEGDRADTAPRTTQFLWKSLFLAPGTYDVQLKVAGIGGIFCSAFERLEVHESE